MIREYTSIRELTGPFLRVSGVEQAACDELAELILPDGSLRRGRVTALAADGVTVQLFDGGEGIEPAGSRLRFLGHPMRLGLSEDMLGRIFDGLGNVRDGGPAILPELRRDIRGEAETPALRALNEKSVHTGLETLDRNEPLLQGQCRALLADVTVGKETVKQLLAGAAPAGEDSFVLILAGLGLSAEDQEEIQQTLSAQGLAERTVFFAHRAEEPSARGCLTPSLAMTVAEYFAFEKERSVLLLLWDMTSLAGARREQGTAQGETPGAAGYPLALEAELAALFERGGGRMGRKGSITLLPVAFAPAEEKSPVWEILCAAAESFTVLTAPEEETELPAEAPEDESSADDEPATEEAEDAPEEAAEESAPSPEEEA